MSDDPFKMHDWPNATKYMGQCSMCPVVFSGSGNEKHCYSCETKIQKELEDHIPTPEERAANHKALMKMHKGNRFRLMFGLPLLPETNDSRETIRNKRDSVLDNKGRKGDNNPNSD